MSTKHPAGGTGHKVDPPTEAEIDAIWEHVDEVVVPKGSRAVSHLHLSDGGHRLCREIDPGNDRHEWKAKSIECYPKGYRDVCSYCVHVWRSESTNTDD